MNKRFILVFSLLILCIIALSGCSNKNNLLNGVRNAYVKNLDDNTYTDVTHDKAFKSIMTNIKWEIIENKDSWLGWGDYFVNMTGKYSGSTIRIEYDTLKSGGFTFFAIYMNGEELYEYEYYDFMRVAMKNFGYDGGTFE